MSGNGAERAPERLQIGLRHVGWLEQQLRARHTLEPVEEAGSSKRGACSQASSQSQAYSARAPTQRSGYFQRPRRLQQ